MYDNMNEFGKEVKVEEPTLVLMPEEEKTKPPVYPISDITRHMDPASVSDGFKPVAGLIYQLAVSLDKNLPPGPEKTVGLRKLLEAREAFIRSLIKFK